METPSIKNIVSLTNDFISSDKVLVDQKIFRLTKPGENYGSLMLGVDLVLQDKSDGKKNVIHAVAKCVPPNLVIREYFNTAVTFRSEVEFYKNIVPALRNFQQKLDVEELNIFPECIGARSNINNSDGEVDDDAVIMLENLKLLGYQTIDSRVSFDLDTSLLIIQELAKFHGTTLALKVKEPNNFETKIKKYSGGFVYNADNVPIIVEAFTEILQDNEELVPFIPNIIKTLNLKLKKRNIREPYATLIHNDFWTSNVMFKLKEGKPDTIKMVDFAVYDYGSPYSDLLFFIFSSVQPKVLVENVDRFLQVYHKHFSDRLNQLECSSLVQSFEDLKKEVDEEAKSEFFHVAFMVFPIFADKSSVPDISKIDKKQLLLGKGVNDLQRERAWLYSKEFIKRNWLCN